METTVGILAGLGGLIGVIYYWLNSQQEHTVFEYEKGLLFQRGRFTRLLETGTHRLSRKNDYLVKLDTRPNLFTVPGQEILTKDKVSIKLSAGMTYRVIDAQAAMLSTVSYQASLYAEAQAVLRDVAQTVELDALLGDRTEINTALQGALSVKAAALGLEVQNFSVRDVMLPAALKKAFNGILEVQKEAQIALEKARGEQAVLRSLANTSRLYTEHPGLLSARLVQVLDAGAHTLVFNADNNKPALISSAPSGKAK